MSQHLFVYGTLMNTFDNEMSRFLQRHSSPIGQGRLSGKLYDVGAYPAATYDDFGLHFIKGQVFEMHDRDAIFNVLDPYEGVEDDLYVRQVCPVLTNAVTGAEQQLLCWVYLFNRSTSLLRWVESGDYLAYLANEKTNL